MQLAPRWRAEDRLSASALLGARCSRADGHGNSGQVGGPGRASSQRPGWVARGREGRISLTGLWLGRASLALAGSRLWILRPWTQLVPGARSRCVGVMQRVPAAEPLGAFFKARGGLFRSRVLTVRTPGHRVGSPGALTEGQPGGGQS